MLSMPCWEEGLRVKILEVDPDFVLGFGKNRGSFKFECIDKRLPRDSEILKIGLGKNTFNMVLHSKEFPALHLNELIPILKPPVFRNF